MKLSLKQKSIYLACLLVSAGAFARVPSCWNVPNTQDGVFAVTIDASRVSGPRLVEAITEFNHQSEFTWEGAPVSYEPNKLTWYVKGREYMWPARPTNVWHRDVLAKLAQEAAEFGLEISCSPTAGATASGF